MIRKSKNGQIGRTMTLLLVIIFVFLLMAAFDVFSAIISANKKGNSDMNEVYEIDQESVLYREVNVSGEKTVLLNAIVKDFEKRKASGSEFSKEVSDSIIKMMENDSDYAGSESCLAIEASQNDVGDMILSIKNFFKKTKDNKVEVGVLSRALADYPYFSKQFTKAKLKLNSDNLDIYQNYGVCK